MDAIKKVGRSSLLTVPLNTPAARMAIMQFMSSPA
jgi:hypothetical protein